jgi:ABC-type nitrate/sulfonate/bicarbonate transport system substrate-binding protein
VSVVRVALRLGVFSPSVLLGVAATTGALDRAGLAVEEVPATSSPQQFAALLAGDLDAVLTSPDNILAHPHSGVRILAAVDRGLGLSLFARPGIRSTGTDPGAGLRGGVLAVDVPRSGFAFVAYALLARLGLHAGLDYDVRAIGSTPRRAAALAAGECTMSVLNAGSDLRAETAGCARISRASTLGPYVGAVLAAPSSTVEADAPRLRALTSVLLSTARALVAGRLARPAAEVTAARLGLDLDGVGRYLRTLTDPREGLVPTGRLDARALETICWLRSSHGAGGPELDALLAPDSGLVDERFLSGLSSA